jgi:hypothetical protein
MTKPRLFAVTLGGRAPKANTELHDVVFVTGSSIEDTYTQLLDKWFGNPVGLHLDSWLELDVVDGWRISLSPTADASGQKLFFVNLGAYDENFAALHANGFYVAESALDAKKRALGQFFKGGEAVAAQGRPAQDRRLYRAGRGERLARGADQDRRSISQQAQQRLSRHSKGCNRGVSEARCGLDRTSNVLL